MLISYGVSMRIMILVKDNNTLGLHCEGYKDLISNSLIQYIQENTINSIMISYHAPVSLSINTQAHIKPPTRWRFNTSHMEGPDFNSTIKREWSSFLEINKKISACLADITSWMARYHLKLNLDKTELLYIPHKTSPLDGTTVTASHSARNLEWSWMTKSLIDKLNVM